MDGNGDDCCKDRDDVETIEGIGVGMGIRVVVTVGKGINICLHAAQ